MNTTEAQQALAALVEQSELSVETLEGPAEQARSDRDDLAASRPTKGRLSELSELYTEMTASAVRTSEQMRTELRQAIDVVEVVLDIDDRETFDKGMRDWAMILAAHAQAARLCADIVAAETAVVERYGDM